MPLTPKLFIVAIFSILFNRFLNTGRRVSYVYDRWHLLNEKDSPVDRGLKKWKYLYRNRVQYTGDIEQREEGTGVYLINK